MPVGSREELRTKVTIADKTCKTLDPMRRTLTHQEASTASAPPKLRTDLTVSKQGTGAEPVFVVKDRVTGQFFRLREAEWFIAGQCDGTTTTEVIRQRTEEEFGAALPLEGLTAFVKKLEKTGLLESKRTARRLRERQGRICGSLLRQLLIERGARLED